MTFVMVLIFKKVDDSVDDEDDPLDDGGPIYLDKQLGDLDEYLDEMQVSHIKIIYLKKKKISIII